MKSRFLLLILVYTQVYAQNDSTSKLQFSAYGEFYYSIDFSKPQHKEKPNFLYNHKINNSFNANLILLKANYQQKNLRANLGLMTGNYAQYNLNTEPQWAQYIYEANVGVRLSKKHHIWLDVGVMPSHLGFESAISNDCWTLTRSLLAENSPYYEAGAKLGYTSNNKKLNVSILYLNGWQKIVKPNFINKPSFGTQINFKPSENLVLNYSSFLGTDKPDSLKAFRHFHNLYMQYEPSNKFGIIIGFDIGEDKFNINNYGFWYSSVCIIKHHINQNTKVGFRAEYYADSKQIIILTGTTNGFQTFGLSTNFDYNITPNIKCRIEGKGLFSRDKFFDNNNNNFSLTSNITFNF